MKKKVIVLIIVIPIVLLIAYLLKNLINRYILTPAVYALHIGSVLFKTVPQYFWWGIFIFILGVVALRSLLGGRQPKSVDVEIPNEERMSRARLWGRWIEMSHRGNYSKWLLSRHFADLVINVLIYRERQSMEQIQARIMSDEGSVPTDIRDYLQIGLNVPSFRHYSEYLGKKGWFCFPYLNSITHYVSSVFRRKVSLRGDSTPDTENKLPAGSAPPATPLQIDPEVIIHFLESIIPSGGSV